MKMLITLTMGSGFSGPRWIYKYFFFFLLFVFLTLFKYGILDIKHFTPRWNAICMSDCCVVCLFATWPVFEFGCFFFTGGRRTCV